MKSKKKAREPCLMVLTSMSRSWNFYDMKFEDFEGVKQNSMNRIELKNN